MKTFTDNLGVIYSEDRKTLIKGNPELCDYSVPKGVRRLETGVFSGCFNLSAIGLSDTIESIGPYSLDTPEPVLIIQLAHSCPLKYISSTAITKGSAFLVPYEIHHEYIAAFPEFDGMFVYGIKEAQELKTIHTHNNITK